MDSTGLTTIMDAKCRPIERLVVLGHAARRAAVQRVFDLAGMGRLLGE